jgi:hypothetical protein
VIKNLIEQQAKAILACKENLNNFQLFGMAWTYPDKFVFVIATDDLSEEASQSEIHFYPDGKIKLVHFYSNTELEMDVTNHPVYSWFQDFLKNYKNKRHSYEN